MLEASVKAFIGNSTEILMSTGMAYPPMQLRTREFSTLNDTLLVWKKIKRHGKRLFNTFESKYSPPIAIEPSPTSTNEMEAQLQDHVSQVALLERNKGELEYGRTTLWNAETYKAVQQYYLSSSNVGQNLKSLPID